MYLFLFTIHYVTDCKILEHNMKSLLIFASGTKEGGGSGFQALVENVKTGVLHANIIAVVSNHKQGGVRRRADSLKISFEHFHAPYTKKAYQAIIAKHNPEFVSLSGWLKLAHGLDPRCTTNIHPGPLPQFGGSRMYGHYVHKRVLDAFKKGEIRSSAVSMHFVTKKYDEGPVFFKYPVAIRDNDTPETLKTRVTATEHAWQSFITNLIIQGKIRWNGKDPKSLIVPNWYPFLP